MSQAAVRPPPPALMSRNPAGWVACFGPGAVLASLTIGSGELIFSARGGALFGYRLLFLFLVVLALKWGLVFATARHMVLTGVHPFERWMALPGPRGWLPGVFLVLAALGFPIWVGFHAGTLGSLVAWLTGTEPALGGAAHFAWGLGVLALVLGLVALGGYARLERIQLVIVGTLLGCVVVSLALLQPDWLELLGGVFVPRRLAYPDWAMAHAELVQRPVWVELATYAGVLGGGGYDYLAYTAYLRNKGWGRAGGPPASEADLRAMAGNAADPGRQWLRAPLVDCTLSFVVVLVFSAVFVACGALVLGPQRLVPSGSNLLTLQAQFVTGAGIWLKPLYFVGAFLAMFGTLYGTLEVGPPTLREIVRGWDAGGAAAQGKRLRAWALAWSGLGGAVVLGASLVFHLVRGSGSPPALVVLLTPANLFTGVLACGLIAGLSWWADARFLPPALRMRWPLAALSGAGGVVFLALGIKGYWDHGGLVALGLLAGTIALGVMTAWGWEWRGRRRRR
ncbi:MAG: hypothetical protein FJ387_04485 [Verrucomicrobia bacterium]|nr:hypothetical protein [Verrucomicrobiota bacterium]